MTQGSMAGFDPSTATVAFVDVFTSTAIAIMDPSISISSLTLRFFRVLASIGTQLSMLRYFRSENQRLLSNDSIMRDARVYIFRESFYHCEPYRGRLQQITVRIHWDRIVH
jgi:hypothetical protein